MDAEPLWSKYDWWLAYNDDKEPVGFAGGHLYGPDNYFYFVRAGVAEVARGRGLQRRLIRVRLRHAAKLGAAGCYTYTTLSNPASSRSLIRCGFVPFIPKRKWGGAHSIYWFRPIDRS